MDFAWSDAARAIRSEAVTFLDEHLGDELADAIYRNGVSHDAGFVAALARKGWIAPEREDGIGATLDGETVHALTEELTKAESPTYALDTTLMVAGVVQAVGSPDLIETIVPAALRGEITVALGMSEPECGSDVAAVRTRARRDGDEWIIDGQKMFTTNGHITDLSLIHI